MQHITLVALAEAFLLVGALSTDSFLAGVAYGTNRVVIPLRSAVVINLISSTLLGAALLVGNWVRDKIPAAWLTAFCVVLLGGLGCTKLFDSSLKAWLKHSACQTREVSFRLLDFHFLLQVYADNLEADTDRSKDLSIRESISLALALSADGLAAGFGAGLLQINSVLLVLLSFGFGMAAVCLGGKMGQKIARNRNLDLSWLSGVILIFLALSKL